MAKIRDISKIAGKYAEVTPLRAPQYEAGVKDPKKDWENETKAAEPNYEEGVKAAIARKAFGKGVDKAGTEAWAEGAITKGTPRYGPGVTAGAPKYATNFAPYRDVIEKTVLPKRYPKGDPRNIERVAAIAKALRTKKERG